MKLDDLLMLCIVVGIALTCASLVAEVLTWQTIRTADLRAAVRLRDMYKRLQSATKPLARLVVVRRQKVPK
jgi:hypothetical protein